MTELPADDTKQCPFCAETIKAAATVCRFCGRELAPAVSLPHAEKTRGGGYLCSACNRGFPEPRTQCPKCGVRFGEPLSETNMSRPPSGPPPKPASGGTNFVVMIVVTMLLVFGCLGALALQGMTRGSRPPAAPDRISAWVDCRTFVQQNLKAPTTAQFPSSNEATIVRLNTGRWSVLSYVDSENSFGAMIRSDWGCQISYNGTQVRLHQLRIGDQVLRDE